MARTAQSPQPTNADHYFTERLHELETALTGWINTNYSESDQEFSSNARITISKMARIFYLKNPLIRRGTNVKADYVFARGFTAQVRDTEVNAVIQQWLADSVNQAELTGHIAAVQKEIDLQTDGNIFLTLFVHPDTGHVRVSSVPHAEITQIITDQHNRKRVLYYKREYTALVMNYDTGKEAEERTTVYYRHWQNRNDSRLTIGGKLIDEGTLVYHIKTGGFSDWLFGVSELYPALDWANAYKSFLEDFATIVKALSRFAWSKKVKGGARGVQAAKTKLNAAITTTQPYNSNPAPTIGAVIVEDEDTGGSLNPIKTANSTTPAEDGRRLLLMVAAAMGLPETFYGDVSVGTLATATSLDRPTELMFMNRQKLWATVYTHLIEFVLHMAVASPNGPLRNLADIVPNEYDEDIVVFDEGVNANIDIDFPSLIERNTNEYIDAIVSAATLDGKTPTLIANPRILTKMLLTALGEDDIDDLLDILYPNGDTGSIDPKAVLDVSTDAVEALRDMIGALNDKLNGN